VTPYISDPCIEFWFLLHFMCSCRHESQREVIKRLEGKLPGYKKALPDIYSRLVDFQPQAFINSDRLRKLHLGAGRPEDANPSTKLDTLVQALLSLRMQR
jgi:hypothetical protein